jgi:hypothetical protein
MGGRSLTAFMDDKRQLPPLHAGIELERLLCFYRS